jgi:hypothetical protein
MTKAPAAEAQGRRGGERGGMPPDTSGGAGLPGMMITRGGP